MIGEHVKVRCFESNSKLIYEYVHHIIHLAKKKQVDSNHKLNILFLIYDSVSA